MCVLAPQLISSDSFAKRLTAPSLPPQFPLPPVTSSSRWGPPSCLACQKPPISAGQAPPQALPGVGRWAAGTSSCLHVPRSPVKTHPPAPPRTPQPLATCATRRRSGTNHRPPRPPPREPRPRETRLTGRAFESRCGGGSRSTRTRGRSGSAPGSGWSRRAGVPRRSAAARPSRSPGAAAARDLALGWGHRLHATWSCPASPHGLGCRAAWKPGFILRLAPRQGAPPTPEMHPSGQPVMPREASKSTNSPRPGPGWPVSQLGGGGTGHTESKGGAQGSVPAEAVRSCLVLVVRISWAARGGWHPTGPPRALTPAPGSPAVRALRGDSDGHLQPPGLPRNAEHQGLLHA